MSSHNHAVALRQKAIQVLHQHGVIDAMNWMSNQYRFETSDELQVDKSLTEQSVENCQKHFAFDFRNHRYEFYLENGHFFSTPDDNPYWGDVRLLFDGELVLKPRYEKVFGEYISEYRLLTFESSFKTLKLGDSVVENDTKRLSPLV